MLQLHLSDPIFYFLRCVFYYVFDGNSLDMDFIHCSGVRKIDHVSLSLMVAVEMMAKISM